MEIRFIIVLPVNYYIITEAKYDHPYTAHTLER